MTQKSFLKLSFQVGKQQKNIQKEGLKLKKDKLDQEEQEILDSYERGEWHSVPHTQQEIKRYATYAKATLRKDKRINIRISERDLELLQRKAIEEGMPYQTLISSLLHKYVNGSLVERQKTV